MDNPGTTVRNFQGVIADFAGFLTENRKEQFFFRRYFRLSFRSNFSDKDIVFMYFGTFEDYAVFIEFA